MDKSLFGFVWRHSARLQIGVLALTLLSFPILYLSLELPKIIINEALEPSESGKELFGFVLGDIQFLLALCFAFLGLVVVNGAFKMRVNTLKGVIGERMVRRLRFLLVERILRFPMPQFAKVSQGEMIATVTAETEPLAGFIGDAYALPVFQGGTMLTILAFMFMQDPLLGLASIMLIPLQAWIIPRLQRQVNTLGKERVKRVRKLSERIGETVDGVRDIRLNGTARYTLAEISSHLGEIFWIRLQIYKKKFFMKFLNNFINQLTPFFFYAIGGILVLQGDLSIGALVAALAAYKDLTAPWKELLNYYQRMADAKIKYEQITEQFDPPGMIEMSPEGPDDPTDLKAPIVIDRLSWTNEYGDRVLKNISAEIPAGAFVGIEGADTVALRRLAEALVRLGKPESGSITIHGRDLGGLPARLFGTRLSYAGPEPKMFAGSIMQNVTYGLRHKPPIDDPDSLSAERRREIEEAEASGNSADGFHEVWTDFSILGGEGWDDVRHWWVKCMDVVGADAIVYQGGLKEVFKPEERPFLAERFLRARAWLAKALRERGLSHIVSQFDEAVYCRAASVAENVLFGLPDGAHLTICALGGHPGLRARLEAAELWDEAVDLGRAFAARVVETYGTPEAADERRDRYPFLSDDMFEALVDTLGRLERPDETMNDADKVLFVGMFFGIVPPRDGEDLVSFRLQTRLLELRKALKENPIPDLMEQVAPFDREAYNPALNVMDNLLFGRVASDDPKGIEAVRELIDEALIETDAKDFVMILFALSEVGIGGSRLPVAAKQRIQYIRGLMKKPDIFVVHQAMSAFSLEDQVAIYRRTRALLPDMTLIVLEERLNEPEMFDTVYDLVDGRLSERDGRAAGPAKAEIAQDGEHGAIMTVLVRSPIFADLPVQALRQIAAGSVWRVVKQGDFVFRSGESAEYVFLLAEGSAEMVRLMPGGELRHVVDMDPPEVIGDVELLAGTRRFSSVRAVSDCRFLRIDGPTILRLVSGDPRLPMKVIEAIGRRFTRDPPPRAEAAE